MVSVSIARLPLAVRSARVAASLALLQASLVPIGLAIEAFEPTATLSKLLLTTYFFTAFPANLSRLLGFELTSGFFGWPTTTAFFVGLFIWFSAYWAAATLILGWRAHELTSSRG